MKVPELVLPGGDLHKVEIAFMYGADAVYVGLDKYSLRKAEIRFSIPEIKEAVRLAHSLGKKLYVTFNIFAHNADLKTIKKDLKEIASFEPDAFIISDPGIISIAKEVAPSVPIHLSTQANTVNAASVGFWGTQGIKRVVLGREVTLGEMAEIKKTNPKTEIEVFAHGAMCISYSGRCLLSSFMTGRSANLGECAQPCRWGYKVYLEERNREGELFEMTEDERGTYIMSSKDLCTIEFLEDLIKAGVSALKIEGRNKTDFYVATVARAYRTALDLIKAGKYTKAKKEELKKELLALTHRDYTTGFLFGDAKKGETFNSRELLIGKKYLGYVLAEKDGKYEVTVKNKIQTGQEYELLTPEGILKFKIKRMFNLENAEIKEANPGRANEKVLIETDKELPPHTFIREN
jgi:putative protease